VTETELLGWSLTFMSDHCCEFITGFHMEPGEDGDPILCEKPAGMQIDGFWYCAEHFDQVEEYQRKLKLEKASGNRKPFSDTRTLP
jgi:hypothetical protein